MRNLINRIRLSFKNFFMQKPVLEVTTAVITQQAELNKEELEVIGRLYDVHPTDVYTEYILLGIDRNGILQSLPITEHVDYLFQQHPVSTIFELEIVINEMGLKNIHDFVDADKKYAGLHQGRSIMHEYQLAKNMNAVYALIGHKFIFDATRV